MCVCFGDPCAQNFLDWKTILRDFCVDWIIGWVVCWIAFISVFFTSRKTVVKSCLDTSSTPPRYLAIYRASQAFFLTQSRHLLDTWWINRESSCLLDSSSTPGGSIELLFLNLILCCSIPQLLTTRSSTPTSTASSIHPDTSAVEHYWRVYIFLFRNPSLISSISLSICLWLFISQTLSFSLQTSSSRILQAFSSFSLFGKLLILSHSCISCFKT